MNNNELPTEFQPLACEESRLHDAIVYFRLWYDFLKMNDEYKAYCEQQNQLSNANKQSNLKEVYDNWGDIFTELDTFKKWRYRNQSSIVAYSKVKETDSVLSFYKKSKQIPHEEMKEILVSYAKYRCYMTRFDANANKKRLMVATLDRLNERHPHHKASEDEIWGALKQFDWIERTERELIGNYWIADYDSLKRTRSQVKKIIANTSFNHFPKYK